MVNFRKALIELVLQIFSYHDIAGSNPEKVYHAFLLGIFNSFSESYRLISNHEAGIGRFDILLIPNTMNYKGIIIEVKKISQSDVPKIDDILKEALDQIVNKK